MKLWSAVAITACVASVDGFYIAGDDVDDEDTTLHSEVGGPVTFATSGNYIDWKNDQGTFRIYTQCLGPLPGSPQYIGYDGSVGPGYVATVWNKQGTIVVDDTKTLSYLGPNSGATGLGMFGFHLVRKPAMAPVPFTTRDIMPDGTPVKNGRDFTHQIAGKWCNVNRHLDDWGGYRGYGVRHASATVPSVSNNVGQVVVDVVLGDDISDLVDVKYTYRVGSTYVKAWVRITTLCDNGACGGDTAFVKEPKLIVGINPADPDAAAIRQLNIFNDTGHTATTIDRRNYWTNNCSSVADDNKLCEWGGKNPSHEGGGGTGQCNDEQRRRVRFWNPQLACSADPSCLVVAARAADTELGTTYPWQSPHGLDLWAQRNVNENRERAGTVDTLADGYLENNNCRDSSAVANRRWEMAGYPKTGACNYTLAVASFHGWEGGTGTYDCEPLYYKFGPRESYVVALSYGFGAAPLP